MSDKAMPIRALLEGAAFDPEVTRVLGEAFDEACCQLNDTGQPEMVREIIARRIIELAYEGERDPVKLSNGALASLGFQLDVGAIIARRPFRT
jgi:hypothetical protein